MRAGRVRWRATDDGTPPPDAASVARTTAPPPPWSPSTTPLRRGRTRRSPGPSCPSARPPPTLPIVAAFGAMVVLTASLIASKFLLEALVQFEWPLIVYVCSPG